MAIIGHALLFLINAYTLVMWGRLILDWAQVLVPSFRPKGPILLIAEVVYSLTDPPLKFIRRWIKPLRVGQVALDLAWIVLIIGLSVLSWIVRILFFAV
ncbi:YggT family protein [Gulosibacter molinativorax]|uniref:YggT family protein n=1 Tax=Gulosibacter molinativorax TaxID=256821 RepID=A0ABT7C5H7_9MICO|nr:YggT family protein [Gulosibacter molinativorax]MDJ1370404.1 YggT family protein [Gulosibacter molinativorax]